MTGGGASLEEQALVELAQWLARVTQYSAAHPACALLADKTHETLTRALAASSPLEYGVVRDDIMLGETPMAGRGVKQRLAPHLHARGVLVLRVASGVTVKELTDLVELLTLQPQALFDRGGLVRLLMERGVARVQIEELAHEITLEERDAQRRRARLREFFKELLQNLLAQRKLQHPIGEALAELLEHPEVAVTLLEEDPAGLAEAAAGLALVVRQEEARGGNPLAPKLRRVLLALAPQARHRLLIGFPALVGELRQALAWAFDGFTEQELARMAFPSVRARAGDLDVVLYALGAVMPIEERRLAALRWLALLFFDLPADESAAGEMLTALGKPVAEYDSFRKEKECLQEHALRAVAARAFAAPEQVAGSVPPVGSLPPPARGPAPFTGRASIAEVVRVAARSPAAFERLCRALPAAATALADEGATDAVVGVVRGLSDAARKEARDAAESAMHAIGTSPAAAKIFGELDEASNAIEGEALEDMVATVKLLVAHAPAAALDRLEASESRKMRRALLEALPLAGASLLPLVRERLRSPSWFVVRNAVTLIARSGGAPRDLLPAARHPNEKVRLEIARALRAMALDEAAMDIVVQYLTDASAEVKGAARPLLRGDLVGVGAVSVLERFASDEHQPDDLRHKAVDALGRSKHPEAAAALFKLLQPKGLIELGAASALRDGAASALHASPAPGARELFSEGLASSTWRVRKACERAAGKS